MNIIVLINEVNVENSNNVGNCEVIVDSSMSPERIMFSLNLPPLMLLVDGELIRKQWYNTPLHDLVDNPLDKHYFCFVNPMGICGWRKAKDNNWKAICYT